MEVTLSAPIATGNSNPVNTNNNAGEMPYSGQVQEPMATLSNGKTVIDPNLAKRIEVANYLR